MAYEHDIFVSYMHDPQMEDWVHEHLLRFVKSFVGNAINRPVDIFVDRTGIQSGDSWPLRIKSALAKSRCLLAVWSPLYFHSEWCRKECSVMLHRESICGFRTLENPSGLVIPINVFDGDFFPERAKQIEWLDCREYWVIGDGFARTERYITFQDVLRLWAVEVAASIGAAPAWNPNWMQEEHLNVSDQALHPKPTENFAFTGLA